MVKTHFSGQIIEKKQRELLIFNRSFDTGVRFFFVFDWLMSPRKDSQLIPVSLADNDGALAQIQCGVPAKGQFAPKKRHPIGRGKWYTDKSGQQVSN